MRRAACISGAPVQLPSPRTFSPLFLGLLLLRPTFTSVPRGTAEGWSRSTAPGHRTYRTYSEFLSCNHQAGFSWGSCQIGQITQASQIKQSRAERHQSPVYWRRSLPTAPDTAHVRVCLGVFWSSLAKTDSLHMLRKHLQLFPSAVKRAI